MESHEVVFVGGLEEDFTRYKITEEYILRIHNRILFLAEHGRIAYVAPLLKGSIYKIRKIRFGNYRLFLYIDNFTVYCLAYLHRRECYRKESIRRIVTMKI